MEQTTGMDGGVPFEEGTLPEPGIKRPPKKNSSISKLTRRENLIAFLFILIPICGFLIFTATTMVFTLLYSFQKYNPRKNTSVWYQFRNYQDLFKNIIYAPQFRRSIVNTIILLLSIFFSMFLGLVLAGLLKMGNIKGSKVFQVLYYLPAVSSAVAINIVWRFIFNHEYGFVNMILGKKLAWLYNPHLIRTAIILKNSINGMGGSMILFLAGMLSVPKDYYEAANLDGASKVRQFFSITLPLITPMIFYLLITGLIGGLQSYADSDVFANGATGAQTIVYFIWQRGIFENRYGLAAAASILLAAVIMIITVVQFKLSNKWVYED